MGIAGGGGGGGGRLVISPWHCFKSLVLVNFKLSCPQQYDNF
jgi:hypothetical protein